MTVLTEQLKEQPKTLYKADFNLWLEQTAALLRQRKLDQLDIDNLLEEIEAMGRSEKRAMVSLLTRLFEHLLKVTFWKAQQEYNFRHWRGEILNFRKQLKKELIASPSLKPYFLEIFDECYQDAKEIVAEVSGLPIETFPENAIANVEQVLNESWFPQDR